MRYIILSSLLFLAACEGGAGFVDGKSFLSRLEGPEVPSVQDALLETARNAEAQGEYQQAIALYRQLLDKYPGNKEIATSLGDSYRKKGEYDYAIIIYDDVLKRDSSYAAALEGKGLALLSKGDFETTGKLFDEALQQDPTRWKSLNALGILFTTRGLQPEAQRYFEEALKYNPSSATMLNNLGLSQALEGRFDTAIHTLSEASGIAARTSMERKRIDLNMALVYAITGRLDDARIIASNYYSGRELENNMGLYAHMAKDDELAKAYLNMALSNSKVFYEKAWDNLQAINGASPSAR